MLLQHGPVGAEQLPSARSAVVCAAKLRLRRDGEVRDGRPPPLAAPGLRQAPALGVVDRREQQMLSGGVGHARGRGQPKRVQRGGGVLHPHAELGVVEDGVAGVGQVVRAELRFILFFNFI